MMQTDALSASTNGPHDEAAPHTADDPAHDWPSLDVLRLRYIHRALTHTKNNKTQAAVLLGIDRRTLNRILARERARAAAPPAKATEGRQQQHQG